LLDPLHVFHEAAHHWVETTPGLRFLTCPLVQNGVVRIASQSAYRGRKRDTGLLISWFCKRCAMLNPLRRGKP
jgi:predicted nucleic acid-binding protein